MNRGTFPTMRLLSIAFLVCACTEQEVEHTVDPPPATPYAGPSVYDEDPQCRDLLGPVADTLTKRASGQGYISFPLETADGEVVSITPVGLSIASGTLQDKELKTGTNNVSLKIIGIGSEGGRAKYTLQYRTATDPTWHDYCPPGEFATALRGYWKASAFRMDANRVTFGCSGSAMKKCYGFGYVPPQTVTDPVSRVAWRAHQACTRMARADICGTGETGTRPETPIVIRDYLPGYNLPPVSVVGDVLPPDEEPLHHAPFPAPPDRHFFESAWTWKENEGAVCLERDRWASVGPLVCPNLINPQLDKNGRFCIELGADGIANRDGILVNASKTQDRYIHLWRNPGTGDIVSTIRGFWREDHADPEPFSGYTQHIGQDGILLRNPPYSLTEDDVVPVFSALVGTDDRALLPVLGLDSNDPSFEGYMLYSRQGVIPFKTYTRVKIDGTTDTVSSIGPDATKWGWNETGSLEYVLSAPAQDIKPITPPE